MASTVEAGGGVRHTEPKVGSWARASRRRLALPLIQMAVTVVMLWWSHSLSTFAARRCDMPGLDAAWKLLSGIDAPVLLLRVLWLRILGNLQFSDVVDLWLENGLFVIAVGLLWYSVALGLCTLRKRRSVYLFRWIPLRILSDLALVTGGVLFGFLAYTTMTNVGQMPRGGAGCFGSLIWRWWVPSLVAACFQFAWCLLLIGFFGRDILVAMRRRQASETA